MANAYVLLLLPLVLLVPTGCKKETKMDADCFPDRPVVRTITNQPAVVVDGGTDFYLIEQGTIDLRLLPCNLPEAFQKNGLRVAISGRVKAIPEGPRPCCAGIMALTSISQ